VAYFHFFITALSTNQTLNPILGTDDVPKRLDREFIPAGAIYPANERYTLQCLITLPLDASAAFVPTNRDAAFRGSSDERKPSALLLHYNYGAAAVKMWGHGKEVLEARRQPPRPPPRQPAPVRYGPTRGRNDRRIAIEKRERHQSGGRGAGSSHAAVAGAGSTESLESDGKEDWDEDDVMLYFMLRSRATRERLFKKVEEDTERVQTWREAVTRDST
jgi:hypothetical protein